MNVDDLIVEIRDASLTRVGQVPAEHLPESLFAPVRNGVGAWRLNLPSTVDGLPNELATALQTPGAGVIVTGPGGVILSGPMTAAVEKQSPDDLAGSWVFTGISDAHVVWDALAFPSPVVADAGAQTTANDIRTGAAESLLHEYVNANVGPDAPTARRNARLVMGPNLGLGAILTKSPRFQNLLELLQEICMGSELWFDVVQVDDHLEFVTGVGVNRADVIRMDVENGQLGSVESGLSAPSLTDAFVAGQGEGTERTIIHRENVTVREEWGRRIEVFIDQRQTDDLTELTTKGDQELAERAITGRSLKVVPSDDLTSSLGVDWLIGDTVAVVVRDQEIPARVNAAVIAVKSDGVYVGCTVGSDTVTDWESGVDASIGQLGSRVSSLERNDTNRPWVDLQGAGSLTIINTWSGVPVSIVDQSGGFSIVSTRVRVPEKGRYWVSWNVRANGGNLEIESRIAVNGTSLRFTAGAGDSSYGGYPNAGASIETPLNADDQVEIVVRRYSGSDTPFRAADTWLQLRRVS